jgi:hypothetical protein
MLLGEQYRPQQLTLHSPPGRQISTGADIKSHIRPVDDESDQSCSLLPGHGSAGTVNASSTSGAMTTPTIYARQFIHKYKV